MYIARVKFDSWVRRCLDGVEGIVLALVRVRCTELHKVKRVTTSSGVVSFLFHRKTHRTKVGYSSVAS